jgi:tripartite-type tricarboxylate transporter receptor subunit TctC
MRRIVFAATCLALTIMGSVLVLTVMGSMPENARAQDFPNKPVRLVVGYQAGSGVDIAARIVAHELSERWGQQAFVDNRPGAAADLATETVSRAAPDGYTLLVANNSYVINPILQSNVSYDPSSHLRPISLIGLAPLIFVLNNGVPAQSVKQFIALANSQPGKIDLRFRWLWMSRSSCCCST